MDKSNLWTVTIQVTVMAGNMDKNTVMAEAERQLPGLLDGTDFMGITVINAERQTL